MRKRSPARIWTDAELALLDKYSTGELSAQQIAEQTGIPVSRIPAKAHKLGKTKRIWNNKLAEEIKTEVLSLYTSAGLTMTQIEERLGLSYHQIRWCLVQEGIETDRSKAGKKSSALQVRYLTEGEQAVLLQRWEEGVSIHEIAEEIGCAPSTLPRAIRTLGLKREWTALQGVERTRRHFSEEEKQHIIEMCTQTDLNKDVIARLLNSSWKVLRKILVEAGLSPKDLGLKKMSRLGKQAYQSGQRKISPRAGSGKKTNHSSPFQGVVRLRSTTEARRADELDAMGIAWFYEVRNYRLEDGHTYLPDFWVTDTPIEQAIQELGAQPTKQEICFYVDNKKCVMEDVKGWWNAKHPTFDKINAFMAQYSVPFVVKVEQKKTKEWLIWP